MSTWDTGAWDVATWDTNVYTANLTETVSGPTEAVSYSLRYRPNVAETLALTESLAARVPAYRTVTETISGPTESQQAKAGYSQPLSAIWATLTDSAVGFYHAQKNLTETVSLSDGLTIVTRDHISFAETINLSESIHAILHVHSNVSDSAISIAESVNGVARSYGGSYSIALSESALTLSESLRPKSANSISVSEELPFIENLMERCFHVVSISEGISLSTAITSSVHTNASLLETAINLSNALSASLGNKIHVNDNLPLSDSIGNLGREADLAESLNLTENLSAHKFASIHISDTLSLAESLVARLGLIQNLSDTSLTISDGMNAAPIFEELSESLELTESLIVGNYATIDFIVSPRYFIQNPIDFIISPRYSVGYVIDFIIAPRFSTMFLDKVIIPRYSVENLLDFTVSPRYTVIPAIGSNPTSQYYMAALTAGVGGTPVSPLTYATNTNSGDLICEFDVCVVPSAGYSPYVYHLVDSTNVISDDPSGTTTQIPYTFNLSSSESQPDTWSINIVDSYGKYNPLNGGGIFPIGLLDEQPFTADGDYEGANIITRNNVPQPPSYTLSKTLSVKISWGGADPWDYSGIGTAFTYTRKWDEGPHFNFSWKGTDYSLLLDHDSQTMTTVHSGPGHGINTFISVLTEILVFYKIQYNFSNIVQADNYPVPLMHRQNGNPRDWVANLLGALLYEWEMVGGVVFTPYLPAPLQLVSNGEQIIAVNNYNQYGNNTYMYDPSQVVPTFINNFFTMAVYSESYNGSLQKLYNRVVAIRAAEGGSTSYSLEVFQFGDQYEQSFDPPLSGISVNTVYANNGFFSNFKFYNGSNLIATRQTTSGSVNYGIQVTGGGPIINCTSVKFTWGVAPGGFIGLGAPGKIQFTGQLQSPASQWGGAPYFDAPLAQSIGTQGTWDFQYIYNTPTQNNPTPGFKAMSQNIALIQKYGLRQLEIQANPLIPNKLFLQKFADRWLYRVSRQCRKATYRIPLNLQLNCGNIIRELDYSLGTKGGAFYIIDEETGDTIINPSWVPLQRDRVVTETTKQIAMEAGDRYTTYGGNEYVQVGP